MLGNEALRNALFGTAMRPAQAPVYVRSDRYLALGCDLRDLKTLERLLRSEIDATNASFLFVAEVSITYMPTPDADSVIRWASTLEDGTCLIQNPRAAAKFTLQLASACWSNSFPKGPNIPSPTPC